MRVNDNEPYDVNSPVTFEQLIANINKQARAFSE